MLLTLLDVIIKLLSGQFLPTWLMPAWLEKMMNALPFIWIYQKPISVFLGAAEGGAVIGSDYIKIVALQIGWIAVLYVAGTMLWEKGKKKFVCNRVVRLRSRTGLT